MKTLFEYIQKKHMSSFIYSKAKYPEKIQAFMNDINEFLDNYIVPNGLETKTYTQERNEDGWFVTFDGLYRKSFCKYQNSWEDLTDLIKDPIIKICNKYHLTWQIKNKTNEVVFYMNYNNGKHVVVSGSAAN